MGSKRLPFGLMSGEYSCSKQYEWQHLTLCQATREQPHVGANLNYPVDAPSRTERGSPSFDSVCDYAKGADGHIHATVGRCKDFPFNWGSSTQTRYYQEDIYLPTYFLGGHFSEIDEAKHRAYMDSFHTKSKPDHTSAGQLCHRDEVSKPLTKKKPFDELHTIDPGRLELPPSKDFHCDLDVSQNCRKAFHGKMSRTKQARQSSQKNSTNRACVSRHGRSSRQKRYGDQLSVQEDEKSRQKRYEDQLAGEKAKKQITCKEQKPPLHHEVHHGGSDVTRNDNWEGNAETASGVGHNGAKGIFHPTKNIRTAATCLGSKKSNENSELVSPKYSSKSIASSNKPKQSEGSSNEKLGSDKQLSVVGCTSKLESEKRPSVVGCTKKLQKERTGEFSMHNLQNLPVTRMEKIVHTENSNDNSPSELLRECLEIWRRRRLRKATDAEAEKLVQTDQTVIVRHGRSATSGSSESADENDVELEDSEKCGSGTSPDGVQKHGQGRAKRNSKQSFRCPSGSDCKKNLQNKMAKQGLICNLEVPPALEPNPCEIRQQKEHNELSTAHQDATRQISQNSCSDTSMIQTSLNICLDSSKGGQAAASCPDSSAYQKVTQHRETHDHLDARRKYKLGVCCEINKKAEGDGVCEQMASLITDPTHLDEESVAVCSPHDGNVKVYGSDCSNQGIETTPSFSALKLDKGTQNNCQKKPVNWSSGSDCRDIQNCSKAGDCGGIQQDTMNCKTDKQLASSLVEPENNVYKKRINEDHQPHQVEVTSNQQTFHQCVARPADRTSGFVIPDLNCLPSMISDEEFESSEEVINQATGHISKPQDPSHILSAFSEAAVQEEQLKEPEKNEFVGGTCRKEVANVSRISDSHSGPPKQTTIEESSTSTHAFKFALVEFVKNILRPLWEDGLLSRDVHKIIVKKAVEKVTVTLGPKVPGAQAAICRFLAEESQSVEKLVQDYLDVYLGKEVLKRNVRRGT
ncbi:uncharacterized protein LOC100828436 [Brachypodium distachyon]|uniref:Uncharacterized protein n=1 Tax=Brachypodium distachyon TaxID=15368 RepID=A0A2K2DJN9_BRADI|nr:uncharacterized protein LOC100828436 [Brachypodium distachyon]XP_024317334.1 uncharacterized protein LOC100828436 [Brachypodium distachyon]XP_024317336.1 uncharacterized protein LOC100828436 [Brachypodium distachyon]XP_024317338.1 uncharacterized protein LOC100828436 [Brachypodium distachyon]PNT74494.1 hypothetical protein BRADI_1g15720v3 [Brachypodium distachyon]PNT74495.1 hypothetical protein BRADI_1g15720v3 [Brachypodium distachyon]PNT74496.1 hypothetical protein BRADI_1g15720v3 [Brachy|eukprot:XP_014752350.1 uncharacterized protein LOC100828436 [Brachypodium distachyon]